LLDVFITSFAIQIFLKIVLSDLKGFHLFDQIVCRLSFAFCDPFFEFFLPSAVFTEFSHDVIAFALEKESLWMLVSVVEVVALSLCHIDQHFRNLVPDFIYDVAKWLDRQGSSNDDKEITVSFNCVVYIHEFLRKVLSEESDFRLDRSSAVFVVCLEFIFF